MKKYVFVLGRKFRPLKDQVYLNNTLNSFISINDENLDFQSYEQIFYTLLLFYN